MDRGFVAGMGEGRILAVCSSEKEDWACLKGEDQAGDLACVAVIAVVEEDLRSSLGEVAGTDQRDRNRVVWQDLVVGRDHALLDHL